MNLVAHLLHSRLGLRVRTQAPMILRRANEEPIEIPSGTVGTVKTSTCAGAVVGVIWDGHESEGPVAAVFRDLEVVEGGGHD